MDPTISRGEMTLHKLRGEHDFTEAEIVDVGGIYFEKKKCRVCGHIEQKKMDNANFHASTMSTIGSTFMGGYASSTGSAFYGSSGAGGVGGVVVMAGNRTIYPKVKRVKKKKPKSLWERLTGR